MAQNSRAPDPNGRSLSIAAESDVHLRVLNLTDLHMEIRPYDYVADAPRAHGGLARAAALIEKLRKSASNSLLFDNGDTLQGNPMGDLAAQTLAKNPHVPHPMISALNALDVDAATLGNHDFNYGLPVLQAALTQAKFPVVSANVLIAKGDTLANDAPLFPPFTLLPRHVTDASGQQHCLTIGVLGVLPPQITRWDRKHLEDRVTTRGIVETAAHYLPAMRKAGADLIIVLCHSGIEELGASGRGENAGRALAGLGGLDVLITGHSHLVFPSHRFAALPEADIDRGTLHDVPTTMAGFGGSHVGRVDLVLSKTAKGWRVKDSRASADVVHQNNAPSSLSEAAVLRATETAHADTLAYVRRPIGKTNVTLETLFAMVEPSSAVRFVATAQAWFLDRALRQTPYSDLPLLSAAAPFKMGGRGGAAHFTNVPAGEVALRHVADLYSYPNQIRGLLIDGAALRDWLEFCAGLFAHVVPSRADQALVNPDFPSFNFDTITGLSYALDITQPARFTPDGLLSDADAWRVKDLKWQDNPVIDDMRFLVATNDYRASGGGSFPGADAGELAFSAPVGTQQILIDYLSATAPDRQLAGSPWALAPVEQATVLFQTGFGALDDPARLRALGVEPIGPSDDGFLRFRYAFTSP